MLSLLTSAPSSVPHRAGVNTADHGRDPPGSIILDPRWVNVLLCCIVRPNLEASCQTHAPLCCICIPVCIAVSWIHHLGCWGSPDLIHSNVIVPTKLCNILKSQRILCQAPVLQVLGDSHLLEFNLLLPKSSETYTPRPVLGSVTAIAIPTPFSPGVPHSILH